MQTDGRADGSNLTPEKLHNFKQNCKAILVKNLKSNGDGFGKTFLIKKIVYVFFTKLNFISGSSRINRGTVFLHFFTVAFFLLLAHKGSCIRAEPIF